jgi:phosphoribosylamine--glycine ligase
LLNFALKEIYHGWNKCSSIGSGGREHALAGKSQSKLLNKLYIAPGNPGTATVGENISINLSILRQ